MNDVNNVNNAYHGFILLSFHLDNIYIYTPLCMNYNTPSISTILPDKSRVLSNLPLFLTALPIRDKRFNSGSLHA